MQRHEIKVDEIKGMMTIDECLENIKNLAEAMYEDNTSTIVTSARITSLRLVLDLYERYNEQIVDKARQIALDKAVESVTRKLSGRCEKVTNKKKFLVNFRDKDGVIAKAELIESVDSCGVILKAKIKASESGFVFDSKHHSASYQEV